MIHNGANLGIVEIITNNATNPRGVELILLKYES